MLKMPVESCSTKRHVPLCQKYMENNRNTSYKCTSNGANMTGSCMVTVNVLQSKMVDSLKRLQQLFTLNRVGGVWRVGGVLGVEVGGLRGTEKSGMCMNDCCEGRKIKLPTFSSELCIAVLFAQQQKRKEILKKQKRIVRGKWVRHEKMGGASLRRN